MATAAISFENILSSEPFRFRVGDQGREFFVHRALFARISDYFKKLIENPMTESELGIAELKEVDEETFIRLAEFAYTGDYSVAQLPATVHDERTAMSLSQNKDLSIPHRDLSIAFSSKKIKKGKRSIERQDVMQSPFTTRRDELWAEFKTLHDEERLAEFNPCRNSEEDDCTEMFLTHARLYAVADWAFIPSLQSLTLYKLHRTLIAFNLCGKRAGDIASLVEYVYDHTYRIKEMRALVSLYAACHSEQLWESSDFQAVCIKHGEFARDYIDVLHRRLG